MSTGRPVPTLAPSKPFVPRRYVESTPLLPRNGRVPYTTALIINHRIVWPEHPRRTSR